VDGIGDKKMTINFNPMAKKYYHKTVKAAEEQQAKQATLERALKYYSGMKKVSIGLGASPLRQIEALYAYVENLNELEKDLNDDFGKDAIFSIGMVQTEKKRAIDQIKSLRLEAIKPERIK
jgi:hypothetical protein